MRKLLTNRLMSTYQRLPISFNKGEGVWLHAKNGDKYLDALSGIAVNTLGYSHPKFVTAISDQIKNLIHVSNLYNIEEQCLLAKELAFLSELSATFFCNSGCEANELAIKIARLHGHDLKIHGPEIIVMDNAFHGRTMATLSASGSRKVQAGFEPLMSGFVRVPFDNIDAIQEIAGKKNKISALFVEPIQGEGGVNIPDDFESYLKELRDICDKNNWLLIFDEVQCGVGRTGKWFAYQNSSIKPDVVTLAKGLASGVPIGACIANEKASSLISPGKHGSTFGGNPLAMVAGLKTLEIMKEEDLLGNAMKQGQLIVSLLNNAFEHNDKIISIRHMGLMIGIELKNPCAALVELAMNNKLLINVTSDKTIRLLPPLIMNNDEAKLVARKLIKTIDEFLKKT
jgi:acetylornithine aminotransferase